MSKRIEFRLSMPGHGNAVSSSWGEGRTYSIVRSVPDHIARSMFSVSQDEDARWYHRWDDGWVALITARVMAPRERVRKSNGFAGYDWMVDNIIAYGSPYTSGTTEGMTPAGHKR